MNQLDLSIVIPCLNEAETIAGCVHEALAAIEHDGINGEVVVADNGSNDASREIAVKAGARVVNVPRKGYGAALQGGIAAARGTWVVMGDADGSYDFGELPRFIKALQKGNDLVMGCRFPKGGGRIEPGAMPWMHRWVGNPVLSWIGRLFFAAPVDDFHCGMRGFRREAIESLGLCTRGMEFASEMVVKATLQGMSIGQVPITLRPDRRSRSPHLRSWRDGWRHLRFMLLYSPNWLFIYPGLLLFMCGLINFSLLWPAPLQVGTISFDLNTLLVCGTAILVGCQLFGFGLFIRAYAARIGLLPGKAYWSRIIESHTVEWGIAIGLIFLGFGSVLLLRSVLSWQAAGFGPLPIQESLRLVILALTGIGLGIQVMVYGFALKILGLPQ